VQGYADLKLFGTFEDDWLRAARHGYFAMVRVPIGARTGLRLSRPAATTRVPKTRIVVEDHWIDYEMMSETCR